MKTLLSIVSAGTGTAAFAAILFAIWTDQSFEWTATFVVLGATSWITGMLATEA